MGLNSRVLDITLDTTLFGKILGGGKKVISTDVNQYWTRTLYEENGRKRQYDLVRTRNSSTNSQWMDVKFKGIRKRGDKYTISLGRVLVYTNI